MTAHRWIIPLAFTALLLTVGLAGAQSPTPAAPNLPPLFSMETMPRRVIYLGSAPGASDRVAIQAIDAIDPESQNLEFACDANGDGIFTSWLFRDACEEDVTMAGPFDITLRVRDTGQAVATQSVRMEARQFITSYVDLGDIRCPAAAVVAGRPAIAYLRMDDMSYTLHFAINERADGSGFWVMSEVDGREGIACPIHLAVAGGRPHIAYAAHDNAEVVIARGSAVDGGAWEFSGVESTPEAQFFYPTVTSIDGLPTMTYYHDGRIQVEFNEMRDGSGHYLAETQLEVGSKGLVGRHSTALVGDPPVLTAISSLEAEKYRLMLKVQLDAGLDAAWTDVQLGSGTANADGPSLAMLDGHPGIAFGDYESGALKLALAESADGQGKWQVFTVDASRKGKAELQQSLALVDGRPAIAYRHESRGLMFTYDSGRDDNAYWPSIVVDTPSGDGFFYPTLLVVAGRPAIVYSDEVGIKLAIAR